MDKFNVKQFILSFADRLDKKAINKSYEVDNLFYESRTVPKIPLIGGLMYIIDSYKLGKKYMSRVEKSKMLQSNLSASILDIQSRKAKILSQLDLIYSEGISRRIKVGFEDETLLKEVCKDYYGLTALPLGEGRYTIVVQNEEEFTC